MEESTEKDWELICEHCGKRIRISANCHRVAKEKAHSRHQCAPHNPHFTWAFPVGETKPI